MGLYKQQTFKVPFFVFVLFKRQLLSTFRPIWVIKFLQTVRFSFVNCSGCHTSDQFVRTKLLRNREKSKCKCTVNLEIEFLHEPNAYSVLRLGESVVRETSPEQRRSVRKRWEIYYIEYWFMLIQRLTIFHLQDIWLVNVKFMRFVFPLTTIIFLKIWIKLLGTGKISYVIGCSLLLASDIIGSECWHL